MTHRFNTRRRKRKEKRRGMMTIEVAASIAVMLPVCGFLFFTGIKIWAALFQTIDALVSWPFL
ncbi:MAG TPA: hypothetical protein VH107_03795 [Lacipirellulaceae bacterium]|jgi:hypothetical protein|nr:hypothetical protein [Lacipirellulaceae bacterium]